MKGLTRCTTVFRVGKTLSEFTILPSECWGGEGVHRKQGGGGDGGVGPTRLKGRERGNDRLIYSKSGEWVNQTLMAFGSASRSLSLSLQSCPSHSVFPRVLPPFFPHSCLLLSPRLSLSVSEIHFSTVTHKHEPSLFLTDKSAPIAAWHANQGALHAQRHKVNDREIKRGRGGDLPSRVAAYAMPGQYLFR